MRYALIQSDEELRDVCTRAARHQVIALDTEFVRTRTLLPQLGLIQLYDGAQLVLIDPLNIRQFEPFIELLTNPAVTKVLHSCSEDLETFLAAFGVVPTPLFDTQFAASVLGMGASVGYARLIEELEGVELDKGESRTDWLARPLSESQLEYAANDVLYLLPAYQQLNDMIIARGKREWVLAESHVLGQRKSANLPAEYAYLLFKNNWRLSSQQLFVLQRLAGWRLTQARVRNLALNFVFREAHLYEVALRMPTSRSALQRIHVITPQEMRMHGSTVVRLVEEALADFDELPSEEHPQRVKRLTDVDKYKQLLASLKATSEVLAKQNGVPLEVIASKKQLNQLLKWYWFSNDETRALGIMPDVLSGWRHPLFIEPVVQLLGALPDPKVSI